MLIPYLDVVYGKCMCTYVHTSIHVYLFCVHQRLTHHVIHMHAHAHTVVVTAPVYSYT